MAAAEPCQRMLHSDPAKIWARIRIYFFLDKAVFLLEPSWLMPLLCWWTGLIQMNEKAAILHTRRKSTLTENHAICLIVDLLHPFSLLVCKTRFAFEISFKNISVVILGQIWHCSDHSEGLLLLAICEPALCVLYGWHCRLVYPWVGLPLRCRLKYLNNYWVRCCLVQIITVPFGWIAMTIPLSHQQVNI